MKFIKRITNFIKLFIQRIKQKKHKKQQSTGLSYIDARKSTNVLDVDLLNDNISKSDNKKVRQYTKKLITALTIFACIWISWSYILASIALCIYGNPEPLSTLSEKVCEVIIGAVIAYCLKAFFESFAEKGMSMIEEHWNNNTEHSNVIEETHNNNDNNNNNNEPVG